MDAITTFRQCPHYDEIINFPYENDDVLSAQFIKDYQELVLEGEEEPLLEKIDHVLADYIKQDRFYKYVQHQYETDFDILYQDIKNIISIYEKYLQETKKEMTNTKWL